MTPTRREFLKQIGSTTVALSIRGKARGEKDYSGSLDDLKAGWLHPACSYRPHTRWWWPGSAVTREGITWQLEQMRSQGMGGVEINLVWRMYDKGYLPFLSDEWMAMVRHAIQEAERLDMQLSVAFVAGWSLGGFWVEVADRCKVLAPAWVDLEGPGEFNSTVPRYKVPKEHSDWPTYGVEGADWDAPDANRIVAVVAGQLDGERLLGQSLIDLTPEVDGDRLQWKIPSGRWRLMAFRLVYTGQECQGQNFSPKSWVIDHFNKDAVQRYVDYLGAAFYTSFGEEFGRTVDSLFFDSFEIHPLPNSLLWSNDTLANSQAYKGYELAKYLPAIWWDVGDLTPRLRYDINEYLHQVGLDTFYATIDNWFTRHNIQARVQPHYRFTVELIQAAGAAHRPETEDCTARFEVVADPRKSTAAGGRFYGRGIVSAESYTFLHDERYRSKLEEMKIASDAYLRDGVTQFYNHGYLYTPEMNVSPARDMPWANRISHVNTWWRYYGHLAAYVSRCCFMCRRGQFVGDVLVYSPQATVWSHRVLFGTERRIMPYGNLPKTLVANGYDFDPVNDDVLQNHARIEAGEIHVRDLQYRFLILPRIYSLPVRTAEFIRTFAMNGGVVIALEQLPSASVGMSERGRSDERVKSIVAELLAPEGGARQLPGGGRTYFFPEYKIEDVEFSPFAKPYQPTPPLSPGQTKMLEALRSHLPPDFRLEGDVQSDGLTFLHRREGDVEIYFVTNLQPRASRIPVTFRIHGKYPEIWNPMTGDIQSCEGYRVMEGGIQIPVDLHPWASIIYVFSTGTQRSSTATVHSAAAPTPGELSIQGPWRMVLEGYAFPRFEATITRLSSWTSNKDTAYFSGTGVYETSIDVSPELLREDVDLVLDLGEVGDVAEVEWNGRALGVVWMQPYRLPMTGFAKPGRNTIRLLVTNTPQNVVSGMQVLPGVPKDLEAHYGPTDNTLAADCFGASYWEKVDRVFKPLPPSGLMGPVRLVPSPRSVE